MDRRLYSNGLARLMNVGGVARPGVKSVQFVTGSISSGATTANITISAVDTANSIISVSGYENAPTQDNQFWPHATFTSSTNVRLTKGSTTGNSCTLYVMVVEYYPGAMKSIQAFSITNTSGSVPATATATLSPSVNTSKTILYNAGFTNTGAGTTVNCNSNIQLTNSTTVTNYLRNAQNHVTKGHAVESY